MWTTILRRIAADDRKYTGLEWTLYTENDEIILRGREAYHKQYVWYLLVRFMHQFISHGPERVVPASSRQWALFALSQEISLRFHFSELPARALIACHHRGQLWRENGNGLDMAAFFLTSGFFDAYRAVMDFNLKYVPKGLLAMVNKKLFQGLHSGNQSSDANWSIVEDLLDKGPKTKCVIVYPEYDGMMYWGDRTMCSRPGLFAASLAFGIPIIDSIVIEPTATTGRLHMEYFIMSPPAVAQSGRSETEFVAWRAQNRAAIMAYRDNYHEKYIRRLNDIEARLAACWTNDSRATCDVRNESSMLHSLQKNRKCHEKFSLTH